MWHNNIAEKSSSRVTAPPGGSQSLNLFGSTDTAEPDRRTLRGRRAEPEVAGKIGAEAPSQTFSQQAIGLPQTAATRTIHQHNDIFGSTALRETEASARAQRESNRNEVITNEATPITGSVPSTRVLARPGGNSNMKETLFGQNDCKNDRFQTSSAAIGAQKNEEEKKQQIKAQAPGGRSVNPISWA